MWVSDQIQTFNRTAILELAAGRVPAVRLESFASAAECESFMRALLTDAGRTQSIEQVTRLGISQYEQGLCASKSNYFEMARQFNAAFVEIFQHSFSPLERFLGELRGVEFEADVMREPDCGAYFAGNGKLRNGFSPIHVDFAAQDSQGWAVADAVAQLAWNFYLRIPSQGGDLLLWDKLWSAEDDRYQVKDSYYYHQDVVADSRMLRVPVTQGDVVLINSRNFHAVDHSEDRLAYGSFISVMGDGSLGLWS